MIEQAEPNRIQEAAKALESFDISADEAPAPAAEEVVQETESEPQEPVEEAQPKEEPEDVQQESEEPEAEAGEPEEKEEDGSDSEEGDSEAKEKKPHGGEGQELRRKIASAERARAEARAAKAQAEAMRQDLEQRQKALEAREKLLEDPNELLREYSKRLGKSEDDILREWTKDYVERQENPQKAAEHAREVARREAREEIERERAEQAKRQAEASRQAVMEQMEQMVLACKDIPYNEEYAKQLPHLASLSDGELEGKVRSALGWAVQNAPQASLMDVLKELDSIEGNAYIERQQRLSRWKGTTTPDPKPSEGKASPPEPGRQLSNRDSAASPGPRKLDDKFARYDAAAKAMPDFGPSKLF